MIEVQTMKINGNETSNNYEMLFELIKTQRVICYVDYNRFSQHRIIGDDEPIWDICEAQFRTDGDSFYELLSRGHCYFYTKSKDKFIEKCKKYQVSFVLPTQSATDLASSLLELFSPIVFETPEALHAKAKELDCIPFKGASDIQYLKHIAAKMYKNDHRLFCFKKAFSDIELRELVMVEDFNKTAKKENIYLSGNKYTGVLYVVENQKDQELK